MKKVKIGFYNHNMGAVEVIGIEGKGAAFTFSKGKFGVCQIEIGMDDHWAWIVTSALHELYELFMCLNKRRFKCVENNQVNHGDYLFLMTHLEFQDITTEVGFIFHLLMNDLKKASAKWNKERKEKAKAKAKKKGKPS